METLYFRLPGLPVWAAEGRAIVPGISPATIWTVFPLICSLLFIQKILPGLLLLP